MGIKGIYPAVSGAIAQSQRLDTISNNIANSNTVGFKRDEQTFREFAAYLEKESDLIKVPRNLAAVESFYDQMGREQSLVDSNGSYIDFTPGPLIPTQRSLDVAIEGNGFFEILGPNGPLLTRKGQFQINGEGVLTDNQGRPVLSADVGSTEERIIRVNPNLTTPVRIEKDGSVYQGSEFLGQVAVVSVQNLNSLRKEGTGYFRISSNENLSYLDLPTLRPGYLEGSNVNIVKEMTDMIQATRAFETNQRLIKAYDGLADKLVNQIPKF